ncbi:MarR family winged helix-turn-helix transcriptional regulator [Neomicrococcus lactis]|uniref:DNA-binding MarR family transcriptional regulator n=2 Tax=Neomicrococcus lactis TaxID=732241 RepID=A0A7W8YBJ8_9MICC|nr:DNA-binding MarR family transcriptional regulator [Neomicrococcus lactis]
MTSEDLVRERLPETIDRETFIPAYLGLVASAHTWGGSRIYSEKFGITAPDFAIISTLSNYPGVQASEITDIVGLDKSVVSRRLQRLAAKELVKADNSAGKRLLFLTRKGAEIHNKVLPVALDRSERMLTGFTEQEKHDVRNYLRRMFENIPRMNYMD